MQQEILLSDELARRVGVRHGLVVTWINRFRADGGRGAMGIAGGGERRFALTIPAAVAVLALATPVQRQRADLWLDLIRVSMELINEAGPEEGEALDAGLGMLGAILTLADVMEHRAGA